MQVQYRFVSRPHNIIVSKIAGRYIAATFELEDLFQLVIPSSCCDEPLKQQLWVYLYRFIVDSDSWCTLLSVTAWVFVLKLCYNTFCCAINVNIFSLTYFEVSTFIRLPALIPVAMLRKMQLSLNGFLDSRNSNSSHEPAITSKLQHCIIYISANLERHQPDEELCFGHATTSGYTSTCLHAPHDVLLNDKTRGKFCPEPIWSAYNVEALVEVSGKLWMGLIKFMYLLQVYVGISCTSLAPRHLSKTSYHTLIGCGVPRCPSVLLWGTYYTLHEL